MDAKIVMAHGTLVKVSKHSGMKLYRYNGSLWAIFPSDLREHRYGGPFAYLWGRAG